MGRLLYWTKKVVLWPFRPITRLFRDWLAGFIHTYFYEALDHARRLNQLLESAPAQIDARVRTVEDLMRSSDQVLLSVVRALPQPHEIAGFRVAPLGDGWLLAPHPQAKFIYLDADDHTHTPHIVAGFYEVGSTLALLTYLRPNSVLWEPTPNTGYHVLTAQQQIHGAGQIVVAEQPATTRDVLTRNLTAHPSPKAVRASSPPANTTIVRLELTNDDHQMVDWLARPVTILLGFYPARLATTVREALPERLRQAIASGRIVRIYEDGRFVELNPSFLVLERFDHCCLVLEPARQG